jgi:hypothetical protein
MTDSSPKHGIKKYQIQHFSRCFIEFHCSFIVTFYHNSDSALKPMKPFKKLPFRPQNYTEHSLFFHFQGFRGFAKHKFSAILLI